ncbi:MAG: flagellar biosynthetic protein FliO [Fibrobacterota bacterium]
MKGLFALSLVFLLFTAVSEVSAIDMEKLERELENPPAEENSSASEEEKVSPAKKTEEVNAVFLILRIAVYLIIILGLIYLSVLLLKKTVFRPLSKGRQSSGNIEVLEAKGIGPGKTLSVIRVFNKTVVLAIGRETVVSVAELDSSVVDDMIGEREEKVSGTFSSFSESINHFLNKEESGEEK